MGGRRGQEQISFSKKRLQFHQGFRRNKLFRRSKLNAFLFQGVSPIWWYHQKKLAIPLPLWKQLRYRWIEKQQQSQMAYLNLLLQTSQPRIPDAPCCSCSLLKRSAYNWLGEGLLCMWGCGKQCWPLPSLWRHLIYSLLHQSTSLLNFRKEEGKKESSFEEREKTNLLIKNMS